MTVRSTAKPIGVVLRELREARGWTQADLTARSGVSLAALRDLEQGRTRRPRREAMVALVRALELTPDQASGLLPSPAAQISSGSSAAPAAGAGAVRVSVRISVLGPLTVTKGNRPVEIPDEAAAVLRRLALTPGVAVSADELATLLSQTVVDDGKRVRDLIAHLQDLVAPVVIRDSAAGYALEAGPDVLDLARFRELASVARRSADAASLWAEAVRLWPVGQPTIARADALSGSLATALGEEYAGAVLACAAAARESGDLSALELTLPRLRDLAAELPLHEPVHAGLIASLGAAGRHAEALQVYDAIVRRLEAELGLDPSQPLVEARLAIGELRPGGGDSAPAGPGTVTPVPRQTPAPPAILVGREVEIDRITTALSQNRLALVTGPAGSGKSSVALAAAHRMVEDYPDGQLYADLFGSPDSPADPGEIIGRFLRALGVAARDVPTDPTAATDLLRTRMADKRRLVVLDSARSVEQVIRVLDGLGGASGATAVIVTSRQRLPDLVAYVDLVRLDLDRLGPEAAVDLLTMLIGDDRPQRDPDAAGRLADACDRLPLALRIAAARLAARPHQGLHRFAERLTDRSRALAELAIGHTSVAAAFQVSYDDLSPERQRAFRLGALIPGPHFGATTAAAVLDLPVPTAQDLLDDLVDASMLRPQEPDRSALASATEIDERYSYHDLLRLYADQLNHDDPEVAPAVERLARHYLHHADAAVRAAYRGPFRAYPEESDDGVFADERTALGWLNTETETATALIELAADTPALHALGARLAEAVLVHLERTASNETRLRVADAGLRSAAAEPRAAVALHLARSSALSMGREAEEAYEANSRATRIAEREGWVEGLAQTWSNRAWISQRRTRWDDTIAAGEKAIALLDGIESVQATGIRARTWGALSGADSGLGNHDQAIARLTNAYEAFRAAGAATSALTTQLNLGTILGRAGDTARARPILLAALAAFRQRADPRGELFALSELIEVHLLDDNPTDALSTARQAHDIIRTIGDDAYLAATLDSLGYALLANGATDEAAATFRDALRSAEESDMAWERATAVLGLAKVALARGDLAAARAGAEEVLAAEAEHGWPPLAAKARDLLAQLV